MMCAATELYRDDAVRIRRISKTLPTAYAMISCSPRKVDSLWWWVTQSSCVNSIGYADGQFWTKRSSINTLRHG